MAKLGVGVGEEFPVDETAESDSSGDKPADDEARGRAWRAEREAMRAEWRARRRAFREEMRRRWQERFGDRPYEDHRHRGHSMIGIVVLGVMAIVALVALVHVLVPLLILALVATLAVVFLGRHRYRHYHYCYDDMPPRRDSGA